MASWWGRPLGAAELAQLREVGMLTGELVALDESLDCRPAEMLADFVREHPDAHRYLLCDRFTVTASAGFHEALDMLEARSRIIRIVRPRGDVPDGSVVEVSRHPNIVAVHEVFVHAGHRTMVLEWCRGTLGHYRQIHDARASTCRAIEAGRGLAHLHAEGLVHGDIRAASILISGEVGSEGVGKLADCGLACAETRAGSPPSLDSDDVAPERQRGVLGLAGDVYSLASTIKRMLPRKRDLRPSPLWRVLGAAMSDEPGTRPGLTEWLDELESCVRVLAELDARADVGR